MADNHLMRRNGPHRYTEHTEYMPLRRDAATGHLLLQAHRQVIPLPSLGQTYFIKELEVRQQGYSDRQAACDAWNTNQASEGRDMQLAFDAAEWEQRTRGYSSSDEQTSRNQIYTYSGNVIAQRAWIFAMIAPIPSQATGLTRLTSVTFKARPYQTNKNMGDGDGAAMTVGIDVSTSSAPLALAFPILELDCARLDMSQDTVYQECTIDCDLDVSGTKYIGIYEFPEDFNPLKLRQRYSSTGSVCRADTYHQRNQRFPTGGFNLSITLEEP